MKTTKLIWIACFAIVYNFFPLISLAQSFDELNEQADKEYAGNNYQKAIDLATQGSLGQTGADGRGDFGHRDGLRVFAPGSIGERDLNHGMDFYG